MNEKKENIQYYDHYSLDGVIDYPSGIENVFIFDDIGSFASDFRFDTLASCPVRLGMVGCIICKKGHVKLRIGLEDFSITPNIVLIILPEQIFQLIEMSSDFEAGYIMFQKEFFDIQNDFKMALGLQSHLFKQPYVQLPDKDMEEVMVVFDIIKRKVHETTNLFLKEVIQTYIRALFYIACDIFLKSKRKIVKIRKEEIFENFISMLDQNFRNEQNVGWYAEKLCLTPKYMSKLIYQTSGKHASEWIKDYVIQEAQKLLNSSSLSIQQISNELGFSNQSHFGSYFKRYTGTSPKEYKHAGKK